MGRGVLNPVPCLGEGKREPGTHCPHICQNSQKSLEVIWTVPLNGTYSTACILSECNLICSTTVHFNFMSIVDTLLKSSVMKIAHISFSLREAP